MKHSLRILVFIFSLSRSFTLAYFSAIFRPSKQAQFNIFCDKKITWERLIDDTKWIKISMMSSKKQISILEADLIDNFVETAIEHNLPDPYGLVTWDSSEIAANFLDEKCFSDSLSLKGKTVCDLGCGTGLLSLVCASYGANVVALDWSDHVLKLCEINIEKLVEEYPAVEPKAVQLLKFDINSSQNLPFCDILVVSDICYSDDLARKVARRIYEAISRYGAAVLVTDPGRPSAKVLVSELRSLLLSNELKDKLIEKYADQLNFVQTKVLNKKGEASYGYYFWLQQ